MPLALRQQQTRLRQQAAADPRYRRWEFTAEFCTHHYAITHTVPLGKHAGWPTQFDPIVLAQRVIGLGDAMRELLQWRGQKFFAKAERAFHREGQQRWHDETNKSLRSHSERLITG